MSRKHSHPQNTTRPKTKGETYEPTPAPDEDEDGGDEEDGGTDTPTYEPTPAAADGDEGEDEEDETYSPSAAAGEEEEGTYTPTPAGTDGEWVWAEQDEDGNDTGWIYEEEGGYYSPTSAPGVNEANSNVQGSSVSSKASEAAGKFPKEAVVAGVAATLIAIGIALVVKSRRDRRERQRRAAALAATQYADEGFADDSGDMEVVDMQRPDIV